VEEMNYDGLLPKITLVTPVYNGEKYLEATIRSILAQGYPNLEYIIVDDGSRDSTVDIIRKYESKLAGWFSQPNQGMYAALNAGFARSTGEIMGWLNSSDMLHTHGLSVVGSVFYSFGEVQWITGHPTKFSAEGFPFEVMKLPRWSRFRFLSGANKYIQQESTYWRRSLWERSGGALGTTYRAAGDFELWVRFFRHAQLYTVDALIGGYRLHSDAQSSSDMGGYNRICDEVVDRELEENSDLSVPHFIRKTTRTLQSIPKIRGLWHRSVINNLYRLPGPDLPPRIVYKADGWVMLP
jgi:glycosyltransferase involved in cell wall biosynthesis